MSWLTIAAKVDEQDAAKKLPDVAIVHQVDARDLADKVVDRATDQALLDEVDRRELSGDDVVLADYDAEELIRELRSTHPELIVVDAADSTEILDLLAYACSQHANQEIPVRVARTIYQQLRAINPETENLEGRIRRIAQRGTPAQLL